MSTTKKTRTAPACSFNQKLKEALMQAMADYTAHGDDMHVICTENTKTHLLAIGLLPLITCHARCRKTCGQVKPGRYLPDCYAARIANARPLNMRRLAINTAIYLLDPVKYWREIDGVMKCQRFMRLFDSGDANLPGYFDGLCKVLEANPHCHLQGFTKCFEIVNTYIDNHGKLPDNLHLLFSGWFDMLPDNPHGLPESRVYENELPENWLSCGGNCSNCACIGLGCWKAGRGDIVGLKKH